MEHEQKFPLHFKFRKWNKNEKASLLDGVVQQNKKIMFNELLEKYTSAPSEKNISELARLASEQINKLPKEELFKYSSKIDWEAISRQHVSSF